MNRFLGVNRNFINYYMINNKTHVLLVKRKLKNLINITYGSVWDKSIGRSFGNGFNDKIIKISDEVERALMARKPVLALESTIISHGMPFPLNIETAKSVESIVRNNGVIPATIGVINGKILVGMTDNDLQFLGDKELNKSNQKLYKISRCDLPYILANNLSGGTTVSTTSLIASKCGIDVFVTGGIGGVHRGAEKTFDISADLTELGRTPITVISAGVKSILDIEKTLEVLETQGVCVVVFNGDEDSDGSVHFPSFFTRFSQSKISYNVKSVSEAAQLIAKHKSLGLESGILIAVPIPAKDNTIGHMVEEAISEALIQAKQLNIIGKDVTPFILEKVNQLTAGQSLKANIALIENNANIGSKIAFEYTKLMNSTTNELLKKYHTFENTNKLNVNAKNNQQKEQNCFEPNIPLEPVIIGGSICDIVANANTDSLRLDGSTYKGRVRVSLGGVGRNLFDCLSRLGQRPLFLSAIGNDFYGNLILNNNKLKNLNGILRCDSTPTSSCCVILDGKGECHLLIGDMRSHDLITKQHISKFEDEISCSPIVIIDANIPLETMIYTLELCHNNEIPVWYEPTDISLTSKIFNTITQYHKSLMFVSPNYYELESMANYLFGRNQSITDNINNLSEKFLIDSCVKMCEEIMKSYFHTMVITLGKFGVLLISKSMSDDCIQLGPNSGLFKTNNSNISLNAIHLPQENIGERIINVSGGGDCFAAGMIYGLLNRKTLSESALLGLKAAKLSLLSTDAIPSDIGTKIHE